MSSVYFDSSTLDVVDEWLQGEEDEPVVPAKKSKKPPAVADEPVVGGAKHAGLGYVKPVAPKQDELAARLAKQRDAQKRKRGDEEDEGEDVDTTLHHGVVEAGAGLSKASLVGQKGKHVLKGAKQQGQHEHNKAPKAAKGTHPSTQPPPRPATPAPAPSSASAPTSTSTSASASAPGQLSADVSNQAHPHEKRKRPKTRSKQKNIRKDSRAIDVRPNFRPLSLETERILEQKGLR